MSANRSCFVIMPFKRELNYFYLYIKKHIEENHNVSCFRGDNDILTIPLLDKIKNYIEISDIIIADCTGRNPKVFYELGIAHTLNKKVVLITMDELKESPTDIRHFEFIKYRLENHGEFLPKLDNALRNVFLVYYEYLYEKAIEILEVCKIDMDFNIIPFKKKGFISKIMIMERTKPIPDVNDEPSSENF